MLTLTWRAKNYKDMSLLFCRFVLPALASQLLSGVYTIVDGFFVGMATGNSGLAAIGIAYPFTMVAIATGAGIGVGGGALISTSMGRGRMKTAERVLACMVMLMVLASLLISFSFSILLPNLIGLFNVSKELASLATVYALILLLFSSSEIFMMEIGRASCRERV